MPRAVPSTLFALLIVGCSSPQPNETSPTTPDAAQTPAAPVMGTVTPATPTGPSDTASAPTQAEPDGLQMPSDVPPAVSPLDAPPITDEPPVVTDAAPAASDAPSADTDTLGGLQPSPRKISGSGATLDYMEFPGTSARILAGCPKLPFGTFHRAASCFRVSGEMSGPGTLCLPHAGMFRPFLHFDEDNGCVRELPKLVEALTPDPLCAVIPGPGRYALGQIHEMANICPDADL
jgi:hypothetical protein